MTLTLNTIRPAHGSRTKVFRYGRGNASGSGTTAGRGTKGQRARTGGRNRLKLKGMKQMLLRIPKTRGFNSQIAHSFTITLEQLERWFKGGERVTLQLLQSKNLAPQNIIGIKVLNTGKLTKALTLVDFTATPNAHTAIEKAGGKFETTAKKPAKAKTDKKVAGKKQIAKKPSKK
jgi:large subunit ribosomal protein L15